MVTPAMRNRIYRFTAPYQDSVMIFPANKHRKAYAILNMGSYPVEFVDNQSSHYGTGFPLLPGRIVHGNDYEAQGELWVMATTCDVILAVWEVYDA